MSSDFLWQPEEYIQRVDPINQYLDQSSHFLSVSRDIPVQEARGILTKGIKAGHFKSFKDPEMIYYERNDDFVRELKTGTLAGYIHSAIANKEVMVPTLTTYVNAAVEQSLVSEFMKRNATRRGVLKKAAQAAQARGEKELAYNLNMDQDNAKRNNNSMSGSMAAEGSIFENPTGHNTLTSMTRSMSSISNALNERMIGGNRHYMEADTALNNMAAIITTMDVGAIKTAIHRYKLAIPTPEQVAEVVQFSSDQYWRDPRQIKHILEFARKMDGFQRAAVVYSQDIYHVRKLNPEFMRGFIDDFAVPKYDKKIDNCLDYLFDCAKKEPLVYNYAPQIFALELSGSDKDASKWKPELVEKVAYACQTIIDAVQKYKEFIRAFLVIRTVPCSTPYIDSMARRTVVLSDTDSTMFSVDEWVIWYFGELTFKQEAFAVAGAVMFVATQLIAHAMAILSANMNVARDKLFVLSMKPEFMFPVFAQTPVAKHYFCSVFIKEGHVYKENEHEIKGVHLKSSASPASIVLPAQAKMIEILDNVQNSKPIYLGDHVVGLADLERKILASLMSGEPEYYKSLFIKNATSYTQPPEKSLFRFYDMWCEVFAPSYARIEPPPYTVMKVPLLTTSRSKLAAWLASLEDRRLAERMANWMAKGKRDKLPTIYISTSYVESYGMPKEISPIIDTRKIILDLTVINRMTLETLGYRPKSQTLISELGY